MNNKSYFLILLALLFASCGSNGSSSSSYSNWRDEISSPTSIVESSDGIDLSGLSATVQNYYSSVGVSETGVTLKNSFHSVIKTHTTLSYSSLNGYYSQTDKRSNGKLWDMYSNQSYTFNDFSSSSSGEGGGWNKEHLIPQSYFGESSPMKSDLFHVVPTDTYVNSIRSNYPFGETSSPSYTSSNGSKRGVSSISGYSSMIFEPADEYKGDIARIVFYFATAYQDKNITQNSVSTVMFNKSSLTLTAYSQNLFLKWSREDPISQKEIDRNNNVYSIQHNRNPFVDIPQLEEYIWGNKA